LKRVAKICKISRIKTLKTVKVTANTRSKIVTTRISQIWLLTQAVRRIKKEESQAACRWRR